MGFVYSQCNNTGQDIKLQSWNSIFFTKQFYFPNLNGKKKKLWRQKNGEKGLLLIPFFLLPSSSSIFKEGGINGQKQFSQSEFNHDQNCYFMKPSVSKGSVLL